MKLRVIQGFRDPSGKYRKAGDEATFVGSKVKDALGREMVMVEFGDGQRCYVFPHEHKTIGESMVCEHGKHARNEEPCSACASEASN